MGKETKTGRVCVKMPTPAQEADCLMSIKSWFKHQSHLPQNVSDKDLLQFLHCCYYSIEKAKKVIDAYYTIRTHTPELFHNRHPLSKRMREMAELTYFFQLDKPTLQGEKILFFKMSSSDPEVFDYPNITKYCLGILDLLLEENGRQPGYVVVFDLGGFTFGHLAKFSMHLSTLKKEITYVQEAIPFVLMAIHVINTVPVVEQMMNLIRPLLNSELLNVFHFYKPTEIHKMFSVIPKEILPKEYGGDTPTCKEQAAMVDERYIENDKLVEFKESQKVNEKLRVSPSKHASNSLQGSFKKLDLD